MLQLNSHHVMQLAHNLQLPTVVFLGDKSCGKSSIIERIVGRRFIPKCMSNGAPLEITLVKCDQQQYAILGDQSNLKIYDFQLLKSSIEQAVNKLCDGKPHIVTSPVKVTIYSNQCPNLKLVDLPGLTRVSASNNTQYNIEQVTMDLAKKYCQYDSNTLIVCVIPANLDLSTCRGLYLCKQWNKNGDRTLGVLTKIDLMDKGTDASNILSNKEIYLRYGYVGLKNQSEYDNNNSIELRTIDSEQQYFFSEQYQNCKLVGKNYLLAKINEITKDITKRKIKQLFDVIQIQLKQRQRLMKQLGGDVPIEKHDKLNLIRRLIADFSERFSHEIRGSIKNKSIEINAQNIHYTGGIIVKVLLRELYEEFANKDYRILKDISDEMIDRAIKMHQGDSIPGFPSIYAFMSLISPHLQKLREPAIKCLNDVYSYIRILCAQLMQKVFVNYPELGEQLTEIMDEILGGKKSKVQKIIEANIESQLNYLFTNNEEYNQQRAQIIPESKENNKQKIFVQEIRTRVEHYFKIVVNVLRDIIPKNIGYLLVRDIEVNSQLQLFKRIGDNSSLIDLMDQEQDSIREKQMLAKQIVSLKEAERYLRLRINQ